MIQEEKRWNSFSSQLNPVRRQARAPHAACVPAELVPQGALDESDSFLRAFYADFAPAQAEAIRRALRIVGEGRRS